MFYCEFRKSVFAPSVYFILMDYIKQTDEDGMIPTYYDFDFDREIKWDYRDCDLEYLNALYKLKIADIKELYVNTITALWT